MLAWHSLVVMPTWCSYDKTRLPPKSRPAFPRSSASGRQERRRRDINQQVCCCDECPHVAVNYHTHLGWPCPGLLSCTTASAERNVGNKGISQEHNPAFPNHTYSLDLSLDCDGASFWRRDDATLECQQRCRRRYAHRREIT